MPDREVTIRVALSGLEDASAATKGLTDDIKGVGTAAADAGAQAAPLGDAVDRIGTAATTAAAPITTMGTAFGEMTGTLKDRLGPATQAAFESFEKLGNVQGVRGLSVGIAQAQITMDAFKKAVQEAEDAGVKMPPTIGFALKAMQNDITESKQKLGDLTAAQREVRTSAESMSEGWKQAGASGGSLRSMMTNLAETSTGAAGSFAKFGLGVVGVFEAFKVGYAIGKEFDAGLKAVGVDLSRLGEGSGFTASAIAGLANAIGQTGIAGQGFMNWAREAKAAMNEYADVMQPVIFNVNSLMKVHQAAAVQLSLDEVALKKLGVAWTDVTRETTTTAQQEKLLEDALHQASLAGQDQLETIRLNASGLQILKQRLDDQGISYDTLTPRLRTALLLFQGLTDAHTKHAGAVKLVREANEQLNPAMDKVLHTLQQEDVAALKTKTSVTDVASAHEKAVLALTEYAKANGLSAEQVAKMILAQSKMLDVTKAATTEGIDRMNFALQKYGVDLEQVAKQTETLVEKTKRLADELRAANAEFDKNAAFIKQRNADIDASTAKMNAWGAAINGTTSGLLTNTAQAAAWGASLGNMSKITGAATIEMGFAKDGLSKLDQEMKQAALDALAATDAFGNLASSFGQVSGAADHATDSLQAAAWEVRHATAETVTFDAAQKALVESLAKVSDQYGQTSLWVGHLIAQFEAGSISIDDFRKQLATMLTGMNQLPGAFGFTAVEMNKLLTLIDQFKNTASNGWPVGTTTAPYSNPSNPLTGKP